MNKLNLFANLSNIRESDCLHITYFFMASPLNWPYNREINSKRILKSKNITAVSNMKIIAALASADARYWQKI